MTKNEGEHKGVLSKIKSKMTGEKKSQSDNREPVKEKDYRNRESGHSSDYR